MTILIPVLCFIAGICWSVISIRRIIIRKKSEIVVEATIIAEDQDNIGSRYIFSYEYENELYQGIDEEYHKPTSKKVVGKMIKVHINPAAPSESWTVDNIEEIKKNIKTIAPSLGLAVIGIVFFILEMSNK